LDTNIGASFSLCKTLPQGALVTYLSLKFIIKRLGAEKK